MASQLMLAPGVGVPPPSLVSGELADDCAAESVSQVTVQQGGGEGSPLEPGEVSASEIKQEERIHDNPSNPFLKYHLAPDEHDVSGTHGSEQSYGIRVDGWQDHNASPFAHVPTATSPSTPFGQGDGNLNGIAQPMTAIQRRNHARLSDIVTRLQNFNGSITELLAIASVQQQLDMALADLDRAKNQLKDVFRQFELQGHISNRQCHKKNGATRDLTRASQRIVQLTKELWDLQRRESNAC
ncbi:hypothetical protein SAMD00023353_4600220 [Rosellinia necatrix]|uniref:Uncharacterized protein n=1 Tax=Rosellinia necatrix TaxID=77044 RepID=A0A1W2TPF1_ROSNE|nr:hypothetical protein SAMD00023353_4600220 [Rosellinia necatrix]